MNIDDLYRTNPFETTTSESSPTKEANMHRDLKGEELLSTVLQVTKMMGEMRSLEPLLQYAIDELLRFTGAEKGYIILVDSNGKLDFKVQRDAQGNTLSQVDEISHTVINNVITSGESLVLSNALTDPRFGAARSVIELRLRSILCVPLLVANRTIGAIYLENREFENRFVQADQATMELWANQASVAIENARLNDELEVANKHLKQLDEMKSNFVMLVSHELRTPLASVMAYSSLVSKLVDDDSRIVKMQGRLNESVERLNKSIGEIIQVFRMMSGQQDVRRTLMPVSAIIDPVLNKIVPHAEQRNIRVHVTSLDTLPLLLVDGESMKIVFENVIGNALKFTPDNGEISISADLNTEGVRFIVEDTGIGVPEQEQQRVFDIFHILGELKHHSSSKVAFRGGGLGLGLPIARGIVGAHGGTIKLESPGYDPESLPGTTCTIFLPHAD